jgi:uncharacterized membrane protein
MQQILQATFFICAPFILLQLEKRFRIISLVGSVVLCYGLGLLLGNQFILPIDVKLSQQLTEITVPLAIPLLLFSMDIKAWLRLAKPTVLSFSFSLLAISISVLLTSLLFKGLPELWKLSGMLVGVYTGGTPNMSAIGMALEVKEEMFILLNASDLFVCGVYFFIITSIGQKVLLTFLPPFKGDKNAGDYNLDQEKWNIKGVLLSLFPSILILGISVGTSQLFFSKINVPYVILILTSLGLLSSFFSPIRQLPLSYNLGQYILFIFCISIGSMANLSMIMNVGLEILLFTTVVVLFSIIIHFSLAKLARIDADTAMITHVAAIYGPAFVGPVAQSMQNRAIVVSGLTAGLIGYAVGNYLGISIAYLVKILNI